MDQNMLPNAGNGQRPPSSWRSGTHLLKTEAVGYTWKTHIHLPAHFSPGRSYPVVFILHGAGGGGRLYLDRAGWAQKADACGFIAVAPDGLPGQPEKLPDFESNPRLWNSGQLQIFNSRSQIDDVAFFKQLLLNIQDILPVNRSALFLTGHSNGGSMAFRVAAELSEHFAALAPVGCSFWDMGVRPVRPMPTLYMIGTDDPLEPLAGGEIRLPWGVKRSLPIGESLARWAKASGCPAYPHTVSRENGIIVDEYGPGENGIRISAWFIKGHGHNWPGGRPLLPPALMGNDVHSVNATDVIWDFFASCMKTNSDFPLRQPEL